MKKSLLILTLIIVPFGYLLYAQMQGGPHEGMMSGMAPGAMMMMCGEGEYGMHGGMMLGLGWANPHHISMVYSKAENLVDEKMKKKVRTLKISILEKILRQKTEVEIAKLRMKNLLQDPNFKEEDVKKALNSFAQEETKLREQTINALVKLRELVGIKVFEKAFQMHPMEMCRPMLEEGKMPMKMHEHKGMMSPMEEDE